jgi:hypothetical protein
MWLRLNLLLNNAAAEYLKSNAFQQSPCFAHIICKLNTIPVAMAKVRTNHQYSPSSISYSSTSQLVCQNRTENAMTLIATLIPASGG